MWYHTSDMDVCNHRGFIRNNSRLPRINKVKSARPEFTEGFTLIEVLVYLSIFTVSAIFLVGIVTTATRSQVRQASSAEVNQQLSFAAATVQRLVRESSLIENEAGVASTTLVLRMSSSTIDRTRVYVEPTTGALTVAQGSTEPFPITSARVQVPRFVVTKYENPGGFAVVDVDAIFDAVSEKAEGKFSRPWRSAITRISAAQFDSSLIPGGSSYDVGDTSNRWKNGYFSGDLNVTGNIGIGVPPVTNYTLRSSGDILLSTAGTGVVLKAPNGTCFRLSVSNTGGIATTSVPTCP